MWFHYTLARDGRWPLVDSASELHRTLHAVVRCSGRALLLFGFADDHLHLVLRGKRREVGRRVGALQQSLRSSYRASHPNVPTTEPARCKRVDGRNHLISLLRYVIRQPNHHSARMVVPDWQASCFPDLVGARMLPGFDSGVLKRTLPRLTEAEIWATVELPVLEPAGRRALDECGHADLVRIAGAVYGVDVEFRAHRPQVEAARHLALTLLQRAGVSSMKAAEFAGCSRRTVRRHWSADVDPAALIAARLQLAIHAATRRGRASSTPT